MLEAQVEVQFKWLEHFGFMVLKLYTSHNGSMDRIIFWPKWAPAPPVLVEVKRPRKQERALQAALRDDWRARGADVRDMCDTIDKVMFLCTDLFIEAVKRYIVNTGSVHGLPQHILTAWCGYVELGRMENGRSQNNAIRC